MKKESPISYEERKEKQRQQGVLGEKIVINNLKDDESLIKEISLNAFEYFDLSIYDLTSLNKEELKKVKEALQIIKKKAKIKKCQIKTLVPFVSKGYWTVEGEKTISNLLSAEDFYIVSIPTERDLRGAKNFEKYEGNILKVDIDALKDDLEKLIIEEGDRGKMVLTIPSSYVEVYKELKDEEVIELLKYPVSNYAIKPNNWKRQKNEHNVQ